MNSRKHNRWYSILLSLFLLFSLTGCNENLQTETNQTTDEAVVVSQEAEDTEEPEVEKNTEDPDQSEIESQDEEIASQDNQLQESSENNAEAQASSVITTRENIPDYEGYAYITINDNQPYFSDEDKQRTDAFEEYSELDTLGRCGVAYANICKELQPTEPRGKIGKVKPSGWCIFRKNCASVPEERSAVPLQTEQSSAGLLVTIIYSAIPARKFKTICLGGHSA